MKTISSSLLAILTSAGTFCCVHDITNAQLSFVAQARSTTLQGGVNSASDFAVFSDNRNWFGATSASYAQVGQFSSLSGASIPITLSAATGNRGNASSRFSVDFFAFAGTTFSFGGNRRTQNNGVGTVIGTAFYRLERIDIMPAVLFSSSSSPIGSGTVNQPFALSGTLAITSVYRLTAEVVSSETGGEGYLSGTFSAIPTPSVAIPMLLGAAAATRRRRPQANPH